MIALLITAIVSFLLGWCLCALAAAKEVDRLIEETRQKTADYYIRNRSIITSSTKSL